MARTQITEASTTKGKIEMAEHLRVLGLAKHSAPLVNYASVLVSELAAREASSEPTAEALGHMKQRLDTWEQLPVGLNNIGNTCYLNSILQFIYSLTPIREAVMRYGDAQTWNERLVLGRRDGGRLLTVDEIKRALRFVELLKGLFSTLINHRIESWSLADARKGSSSAAAPGHPLLAAASGSSAATSMAVSPDRELSSMLLLRITGNDAAASTGAAISISSSGTLNMQAEDDSDKALGATGAAATQTQQTSVPQYNQQQDVDECMAQCVTFLVRALLPEPTLHLAEASAKSNSTGEATASERVHDDGSWIHRLLAGHQELSTDKLVNGRRKETEPPTTEQFVNLNLNIPREAADINDCIEAFFEPSVVPGSTDEQHPTSSQMMDVDVPEQKHVEFVRHTRIKDAPPVLCIQLQRVQFDVATMRSYKLNSHVRLRSQISLAPYMRFNHHCHETEDKEQMRRRQIKDRLAAIDRHLLALETPVRAKSSGSDAMASMSVVSALERVQAFMSGVGSWSELDAAKELLSDLGKPADTIVQEARQLSSDLGSMAQALGGASEKWRDERKDLCAELDSIYNNVPIDESAYTLHAVFIHSGLSPEYGHYWVYVRDYDKAKNQIRWLCFNDSNVSVVDESVVFNDSPLPGQDTANPYYLVYVRTRDLDGTVSFGV
ncbi:ubiquitin-specific protease ubp2 [Coemansia erecta]|nr:ubiquitin-specific protease ubp2 [Coemansia erecta]